MAKCETECRDEIFEKMDGIKTKVDGKVDKAGVWKFAGIIISIVVVLWTTAFAVSSKLSDKVNKTSECIARMEAQIINLDSSVKTLLWEIRRNGKNRE